MDFCPTCANLLMIESTLEGQRIRFFCNTCPYVCRPLKGSKIVETRDLRNCGKKPGMDPGLRKIRQIESIFNREDEEKAVKTKREKINLVLAWAMKLEMENYRKFGYKEITNNFLMLRKMMILHVTCPNCSHGEAFLWLVQMRILSEPKTQYYKCCNRNCENVWHVN